MFSVLVSSPGKPRLLCVAIAIRSLPTVTSFQVFFFSPALSGTYQAAAFRRGFSEILLLCLFLIHVGLKIFLVFFSSPGLRDIPCLCLLLVPAQIGYLLLVFTHGLSETLSVRLVPIRSLSGTHFCACFSAASSGKFFMGLFSISIYLELFTCMLYFRAYRTLFCLCLVYKEFLFLLLFFAAFLGILCVVPGLSLGLVPVFLGSFSRACFFTASLGLYWCFLLVLFTTKTLWVDGVWSSPQGFYF